MYMILNIITRGTLLENLYLDQIVWGRKQTLFICATEIFR